MWLREERGMSMGVDLHWHRPLLLPSAWDHLIHGTAKSTSCKKGVIAEIEYFGNDKVGPLCYVWYLWQSALLLPKAWFVQMGVL